MDANTIDMISKLTLTVALVLGIIALWNQQKLLQSRAIDQNQQSIADLIKAVDALRDAVLTHITKT
jgi:hypothetical protein